MRGSLEYWKKDGVTMEIIIYPEEGRRIFFFNKEESRFSFGNVGLVGKVDAAVSKGKTDEVPCQGWGSRHWSSLQRNAATRSGGVTSRGRGETAEGGVLEMGDQGQGRREMR